MQRFLRDVEGTLKPPFPQGSAGSNPAPGTDRKEGGAASVRGDAWMFVGPLIGPGGFDVPPRANQRSPQPSSSFKVEWKCTSGASFRPYTSSGSAPDRSVA